MKAIEKLRGVNLRVRFTENGKAFVPLRPGEYDFTKDARPGDQLTIERVLPVDRFVTMDAELGKRMVEAAKEPSMRLQRTDWNPTQEELELCMAAEKELREAVGDVKNSTSPWEYWVRLEPLFAGTSLTMTKVNVNKFSGGRDQVQVTWRTVQDQLYTVEFMHEGGHA